MAGESRPLDLHAEDEGGRFVVPDGPSCYVQYQLPMRERARMKALLGPHCYQWRGGAEN